MSLSRSDSISDIAASYPPRSAIFAIVTVSRTASKMAKVSMLTNAEGGVLPSRRRGTRGSKSEIAS